MTGKPGVSADEALQRLIDGNGRFLRGEAHSRGASGRGGARLTVALAEAQNPL
jgi:hypothetical protein